MDHHSLSDEAFEHQFASLTLNPALFSHEAHLRLAWIHIKKYGVDRAALNMCEQIRIFDQTFDDGTKFNVTVTVAAVKAVHHFMQKSETHTFAGFIDENPRLKHNFKELLGYHYSTDIFTDEAARAAWVEPDLEGF